MEREQLMLSIGGAGGTRVESCRPGLALCWIDNLFNSIKLLHSKAYTGSTLQRPRPPQLAAEKIPKN